MNKPTIEKHETYSVSGLTKKDIELIMIGLEVLKEGSYNNCKDALLSMFRTGIK